MAKSILVTGATGRLGSLVAERLAAMDGVEPRVMLRRGRIEAGSFDDSGLEIVEGDFDLPNTLGAAVDGVAGVFLVSPVHPTMRERETHLVRAIAEQAPAAKVVKVSGLGTRLDSFVDSGRWHAEIEAGIRARDLNATCLRPNFFMQNLAFQAQAIQTSGEIRSAVHDARIAMVDARDIADVAATVLAEETPIDGSSVSLTSARNYDYEEVAAVFAGAYRRPVAYRRQTDAELQAMLSKAGQPDWHVKILLAFNEAFRRGWGAEVTSTVADVLGRAARTLEDFVRELAVDATPDGDDPFPS